MNENELELQEVIDVVEMPMPVEAAEVAEEKKTTTRKKDSPEVVELKKKLKDANAEISRLMILNQEINDSYETQVKKNEILFNKAKEETSELRDQLTSNKEAVEHLMKGIDYTMNTFIALWNK
jgi:seryl-tRNA synthetase